MGGRISAALWSAAEDLYRSVLDHPFVKGLEDGSLQIDAFKRYVIQDYLYLQYYRSVLAALSAKAERAEHAELLASLAASMSSLELSLHAELLGSWGIDPSGTEPSPTTLAYSNFLLATALARPFEEGLAAVLPCEWMYLEVGKEVARAKPRRPEYARWAELYSSEEYAKWVGRLLDLVDSLEVQARELERMRRLFRLSAIYEYMFWDAAYKAESFPFRMTPDERSREEGGAHKGARPRQEESR